MAASDGERSISILLEDSRLWTVYSSLGTAAAPPSPPPPPCAPCTHAVLYGDGSDLREKIPRRTSSKEAM